MLLPLYLISIPPPVPYSGPEPRVPKLSLSLPPSHDALRPLTNRTGSSATIPIALGAFGCKSRLVCSNLTKSACIPHPVFYTLCSLSAPDYRLKRKCSVPGIVLNMWFRVLRGRPCGRYVRRLLLSLWRRFVRLIFLQWVRGFRD